MSNSNSTVFGKLEDGSIVEVYELSSPKLKAKISTYGGRILSIFHEGVDVVYGPKTFEAMIADTCYCGAICGRVANRIANGTFQLEGIDYKLATNNGPNHLHGGLKGFDSRIWDVEYADSEKLVLRLVSPDEEEGYPGNLEVTATYQISNTTLILNFEISTDQPTLCNLTNHTYFNPIGKGSIDPLELQSEASAYTPATDCIPDGRILPVAGTPFDLSGETVLGERNSSKHPEVANGFDHNFVLPTADTFKPACILTDPESGRYVFLMTDAPGVQIYTGEYLPEPRFGIAMEPQTFPDAIHYPHFPSPIILPEDGTVTRSIIWIFDNINNFDEDEE